MSRARARRDRVLQAGIRHHGDSVLYRPGGGAEETITAVFDEEGEDVEIEDGAEVITTAPMLGVRLADISQAPAAGDTLTVIGKGFQVYKVKPDGQGGARLFLHVNP